MMCRYHSQARNGGPRAPDRETTTAAITIFPSMYAYFGLSPGGCDLDLQLILRGYGPGRAVHVKGHGIMVMRGWVPILIFQHGYIKFWARKKQGARGPHLKKVQCTCQEESI